MKSSFEKSKVPVGHDFVWVECERRQRKERTKALLLPFGVLQLKMQLGKSQQIGGEAKKRRFFFSELFDVKFPFY
jgi:hypothetical protein